MLAYAEAIRAANPASGRSTAPAAGVEGVGREEGVGMARRRRGVLLEMSNQRQAARLEYHLALASFPTDPDVRTHYRIPTYKVDAYTCAKYMVM
jgi:hypothetical protein